MATTKELKHIMISYQWDCQPRAIQLRDKLKEAGYNVWMDVEQMRGDILGCMAHAVQNAEVVLICISQKYQDSKNCKLEAEYAHEMNKQIIPLKVEENFQPCDWLGLLVTKKLYYCVHSPDMLNGEFPNVVAEIGDKCRTAKQAKWDPANRHGSKALQCSICLERFKTPKTLPCLHSFCKECLIRVAPLGTRNISCPLCRKQFPVPDGGVTQFPTNFHLKELVEEEVSRQQQQLSEAGSEFPCTCCEVGRQTQVVARCTDCKLYICSSGLSAHQRFTSLKDHKVLLFKDLPETTVEPSAMSTGANPTRGVKATGWDLFDEMYDEEHSIDLLKYWMQQNGGSDWQTTMVDHYLTSLRNLEEDGLISEDKFALRQQQVARVFKQAGQYDAAIELVEKSLDVERKELGQRPEQMADLYYLAADIYKEIINSVGRVEEQDPKIIQQIIKYARSSLKLRKTLSGDDNKFERGKVLKLLSGTLVIWSDTGGDNVLSAEDAKTEAKKHIDAAICIFTELNAKGNVAKAVANKANLEERGSAEREKLYQDAMSLCEEVYGASSVLSGNLHRAMGILYEDKQDYREAYKWFVKSRDIREKIYGQYHPHTRQLYDELNCDFYAAIKHEVEADD